jgi:putative transposase
MPQSLASVLIHLVFSTHGRVPVLQPPIRSDLHAYMAGVLRRIGCTPIQVGGVEDHVHALFALSRTLTLADAVETLKTSSTRWLKTQGSEFTTFRWQSGYGAFSVSRSQLTTLMHYIETQDDHHRTLRFQDELRLILRRADMPYDERYLWD